MITSLMKYGSICTLIKIRSFLVSSYDNSTKCNVVWTANVMAYRCNTCAISPCMSICLSCFQVSFFYIYAGTKRFQPLRGSQEKLDDRYNVLFFVYANQFRFQCFFQSSSVSNPLNAPIYRSSGIKSAEIYFRSKLFEVILRQVQLRN